MEIEKNNQYPLIIIRSFWHHIVLLVLVAVCGAIGSCSYLLFSKNVTYSSTGNCVSSYAFTSTALDVVVLNAASYDVYKAALSSLATQGVVHSNGEAVSYSDLLSGVSVTKDTANYGYTVTFSSPDESIVVSCTNAVLFSSVSYCNSLQIVNRSLSVKNLAVTASSNKHYSLGGSLLIFAAFLVLGFSLSIFLDVYYGKVYSSKDLYEIECSKMDIKSGISFAQANKNSFLSSSKDGELNPSCPRLQNYIDSVSGGNRKTIAFSSLGDFSSYYLASRLSVYSASISRKTCFIVFTKKANFESSSFRDFPCMKLGNYLEYKKIEAINLSEAFIFTPTSLNLSQALGNGVFDLFLYQKRLSYDQIFLIIDSQEENPFYLTNLHSQIDGVILSCFSGQGTHQSEVSSLSNICLSQGLPIVSFAVIHFENSGFKNFLETHF